MKKKNDVLLALVSVLIIFSSFSDYQAEYYTNLRQNSANMLLFKMQYYELSNGNCYKDWECPFSNITFPEFQKTEMQPWQVQFDELNFDISFWESISKCFLVIGLLLSIFVIIDERRIFK